MKCDKNSITICTVLIT